MSWVHAVIDVPADGIDVNAAFWGRASGWPVGPAWPEHPELRSFEPPVGEPYLHLQRIDGPPRVHLDIDSDAPDRFVRRAVELGAGWVADRGEWLTLRSPGRLPFCVLPAKDRLAPAATAWPDGHRSRLVQVCIDSPRSREVAEVAFWRSLLAGRWVDSAEPEFVGKWHDDAGSPIQLLFQRLDETDGPVRAHLDLGTDDLPAELSRLLDLGARDLDLGRGRGWHALRDPAGLPFCATENSPAQSSHRDLG